MKFREESMSYPWPHSAKFFSPLPALVALLWVLFGCEASEAAAPPTAPADPDRFFLLGDQLVWCEQYYFWVDGHTAPG